MIPLCNRIFIVTVLLALPSSGGVAAEDSGKCLKDIKESPLRFFQLDGESDDSGEKKLSITIDSSERVGHQLLAHIFRIFLTEVLHYESVVVSTYPEYLNSTEAIKRLFYDESAGLGDDLKEYFGGVEVRRIPQAMINLGIWLSPEEDLEIQRISFSSTGSSTTYVEDVLDCGQLGFQGSYGWFIPKQLSILRAYPELDSWRTFKNPNLTQMFRLSGIDLRNATELARLPNSDAFYCQEPFCTDGFYHPPACKQMTRHPQAQSERLRHVNNRLGLGSNDHSPCGVLLASYPESSKFLREHIDKLNLHMSVVWLGPKLEGFVRHLVDKYERMEELERGVSTEEEEEDDGGSGTNELMKQKNGSGRGVVFFDWNPSLLTTKFDPIASISFPVCNNNEGEGGANFCKYESRKLEKMVWAKLKENAKPAFEAVHRFSFNQTEYRDLLRFYEEKTQEKRRRRELPEESDLRGLLRRKWIEEVACGFLKVSPLTYEQWKPAKQLEKTKLYIGGIFPMEGPLYSDKSIALASKMAQEAINSDDSILKDFEVEILIRNGQCSADMVMKSFIDYIRLSHFSHMAGILGPACSDTVEPLAGVATHFKTVVISYSAEGSSFSDRKRFPYFFRTIGENKQYQYVYLKLFQHFGWVRVATLTEEGQKYGEYLANLHDLFQQEGLGIISNRKFPRERTALNNSMAQYLQDLKSKKARIIIGDFYDHSARAVLCEAYKQGMTGKEGYLWILPAWYLPKWYDTDSLNELATDDRNKVPCTTAEMIEAINGYMSLQYSYFAPDDHIMQENRTVAEWYGDYMKECNRTRFPPSDYAGFAYDAVWTYAYALQKLYNQSKYQISNLHSTESTNLLVQLINETDFFGVSGHIKFSGGPSRISTIHVVQWVDGIKQFVGSFYPETSNYSNEIIGGSLELNESKIVWFTPDGAPVSDGSEPPARCVLETLATALDVSCEIAIVIANVIGFGILGCVVIVCIVVIKRRYEKRLLRTEDYLKAFGIDILSASNISALDKWEIPRDRVVINRKLGEGAFGNVYGGECFFDENRGWVAVAVKTLKVGSTPEQKLDFLSEAEVMKRFEHKNIIKLLGVCTKSENTLPVYVILEFCLYGDLKTYLLARRHLVNERCWIEESDEISSKRLTSMALDVARALSYLTELKYVHRDIACRNCLVNANRVVKLGDFGMTRPIYENDYYRFSRKGMLPVRWMAPESLSLGLFHPSSDVWSFAVLLYEIITFGSFPFQGKSNNEVLDLVKGGKTLSIPTGVKPQLESLLKACWSTEPGRRPHASEIVEFLANNPRIISPSLDIPLASVQLEGSSGALDMEHNLSQVVSHGPTPSSHHFNLSSLKGPRSSKSDAAGNGSNREKKGGKRAESSLTPTPTPSTTTADLPPPEPEYIPMSNARSNGTDWRMANGGVTQPLPELESPSKRCTYATLCPDQVEDSEEEENDLLLSSPELRANAILAQHDRRNLI